MGVERAVAHKKLLLRLCFLIPKVERVQFSLFNFKTT